MLNNRSKKIYLKSILLNLILIPFLVSCDQYEKISDGNNVNNKEESSSTAIKELFPGNLKIGNFWKYNIEYTNLSPKERYVKQIKASISRIKENPIGNRKFYIYLQNQKGNKMVRPLIFYITDNEIRTDKSGLGLGIEYILKDFQKASNYSYMSSDQKVKVKMSKQKVFIPAGEFEGFRYDFTRYSNPANNDTNSSNIVATETFVFVENIGLAYYKNKPSKSLDSGYLEVSFEATLKDYKINHN